MALRYLLAQKKKKQSQHTAAMASGFAKTSAPAGSDYAAFLAARRRRNMSSPDSVSWRHVSGNGKLDEAALHRARLGAQGGFRYNSLSAQARTTTTTPQAAATRRKRGKQQGAGKQRRAARVAEDDPSRGNNAPKVATKGCKHWHCSGRGAALCRLAAARRTGVTPRQGRATPRRARRFRFTDFRRLFLCVLVTGMVSKDVMVTDFLGLLGPTAASASATATAAAATATATATATAPAGCSTEGCPSSFGSRDVSACAGCERRICSRCRHSPTALCSECLLLASSTLPFLQIGNARRCRDVLCTSALLGIGAQVLAQAQPAAPAPRSPPPQEAQDDVMFVASQGRASRGTSLGCTNRTDSSAASEVQREAQDDVMFVAAHGGPLEARPGKRQQN